MKFKWIVALSAIFIAGCAAYFSVTGIALLFSGSMLGVAIMASSLEIGKLVAASYLHRNWNKLNNFFKVYFTIAVLILIFITSMGIFGFLSNAYQKTAVKVDQVDRQVELLEQRKSGFVEQIDRNVERMNILSNQRSSQEARYDSLTSNEHWVNAERSFSLIENADEEISQLRSEINTNRDSVNAIESEIVSIKNQTMDLSREIGGFKFVAESFNVSIDVAVKWFILMLIFVFDPLAVSLVIAFNSYYIREDEEIAESKGSYIPQPNIVDPTEETEDNKSGLGVVSDKAQKKTNEKRHI